MSKRAPLELPIPDLGAVKKRIRKVLQNRQVLKETSKNLKSIDSELRKLEKEIKALER